MCLLVNDPISASSFHTSEISLPLLMDPVFTGCFFHVEMIFVRHLTGFSGVMIATLSVHVWH